MAFPSEAGRTFNPNHTEVNPARLERLADFIGPDYRNLIHQFFAEKLNIADVTIDIHGHDGSEGTYYVEENVGRHKLYVAGMEPWQMTSAAHLHEWPDDLPIPQGMNEEEAKDVTEEYHHIKGRAVIILGEGKNATEVALDENNPVVYVPPGTMHRVKTEDSYAFYGIVMRNGALIPDAKLHKRPNKQ